MQDVPAGLIVTGLSDLVCVNRYDGWYVDTGDLETAEREMEAELRAWAAHGKPILVTEFGADALPGQHSLPATVVRGLPGALIEMSLRVFARVPEGIGEHAWNFATRPGGPP